MDTDQLGLILAGLGLLVSVATLVFQDEIRKMRLPVRLFGVVGVVVLLAGLFLFVSAIGQGSDNDRGVGEAAGPPNTIGPTTTTSGSSTTGSTGSITGSSEATMRWHETIQVPPAYKVNLDDTGPRVDRFVAGSDLYSTTRPSDTTAKLYAYGSAATAPAGAPSFAGCRSAIEANALGNSLLLEPGEQVCLRTRPSGGEQPHLAHAKVLTVDRRSGIITLDVTVWRQEP